MIQFMRPVLYLSGLMQMIVAGLMMVPCMLEILSHGQDAEAFLDSALITVSIGLSLILAMRGDLKNLTVRQMFMLVSTAWFLTAATSALPFVITGVDLSYTDAFFESVSGLTTSGGTVIVGLDNLPGGILLWRSLTQWLGGIGIIGVSIVLLPFMRIGGMQLFKSESSEKGEKVVGQAKVFAASLMTVYLTISILSALLFHMAGMNWFDAINHMMAAVSTGGFSNKDSSIGYYNSNAICWAATAGMTLGALPFTWYIRLGGGNLHVLRDRQVKTMLIVFAVAALMMTAWVAHSTPHDLWTAFSLSTHNVVSIITTTGFVATDYSQWGSFAVMLFFLLYFVGGCTGSTSGSIKIFRWEILFITVREQIQKMIMPHRVVRMTYDNRPFTDEVRDSVLAFIIMYFIIWLISSLLLALTGLDLVTSLSGALSAISNTGPGFGDIIGPAGNFAPLNDAAKWICSFTMLLGRLEIYVLVMIFTRAFWKD